MIMAESAVQHVAPKSTIDFKLRGGLETGKAMTYISHHFNQPIKWDMFIIFIKVFSFDLSPVCIYINE